jgi:hypothetical protein
MNKQDKIWHDAFHLKLSFRCMQSAAPKTLKESVIRCVYLNMSTYSMVLEACRKSRRERKHILKDLRSHWAFKMLCYYDNLKP